MQRRVLLGALFTPIATNAPKIITISSALTAAVDAFAQSFPSAPIKMIVPYAAGGGLDTVARIVAQGLGEVLGQQVVVDNRSGAGGTIGAAAVAKAAPDGYTLLMSGNPEVTIATAFNAKLPYNPATDFTPVMLVAQTPNVLVAHPSLGTDSLAKIIEMGKRKEVQLAMATPGNGSPPHIVCEALRTATGIDLVHVPFKGAAPAVAAVLSGEVKLALTGAPPMLAHIRAGKLLALAVTQQQRSPLLPDVPTMFEAAGLFKGDDFLIWYGLLLPARTPAAVAQVIEKAVATVLAKPDVRERIQALGADIQASSSSAFAQRMRAETALYGGLVKRHNISAE